MKYTKNDKANIELYKRGSINYSDIKKRLSSDGLKLFNFKYTKKKKKLKLKPVKEKNNGE